MALNELDLSQAEVPIPVNESTEVLAAGGSYFGISVRNNSPGPCRMSIDGVAASATHGIPMDAGERIHENAFPGSPVEIGLGVDAYEMALTVWYYGTGGADKAADGEFIVTTSKPGVA